MYVCTLVSRSSRSADLWIGKYPNQQSMERLIECEQSCRPLTWTDDCGPFPYTHQHTSIYSQTRVNSLISADLFNYHVCRYINTLQQHTKRTSLIVSQPFSVLLSGIATARRHGGQR